MREFEFQYNGTWYVYRSGHIYKKKDKETYFDCACPVFHELSEKLDSFSTEQLHTIMRAILHGYTWGKHDGRNEKIREFKRVFNLD